MQKRSIADHTTTCPYCGHRCLPANLAKHISSIHPDMARVEHFSKSLHKTRPQQWWDKYHPEHEPESIADIIPYLEEDNQESKGQKSKAHSGLAPRAKKPSQEICPACGDPIRRSKLENHLYKIHGLRADPKTGHLVTVPIVDEDGNISPRHLQCDLCGFLIPEDRLSEHRSRHTFFQASAIKSDLICSACGLNISVNKLSAHFRIKHPGYPKDKLKKIFMSCYGKQS
jgi:predicted RNA-binding Zn-ribbon protein involved in translation (DUF1610 family)